MTPRIWIDTTLRGLAVAVSDDRQILWQSIDHDHRGCSKLAGVFDQARAFVEEKFLSPCSQVIVNCGPGSFTGIKIGCAFAQGLRLSGQFEVYSVSFMEGLARELAAHDPNFTRLILGATRQRGAVVSKANESFAISDLNLATHAALPGDYLLEDWDALAPPYRKIAEPHRDLIHASIKWWDDCHTKSDELLPLYIRASTAEEVLMQKGNSHEASTSR